MNKTKYLCFLFLFLTACEAPQAPHKASKEPPSALQRKLADLATRAFKKFQDSGLLHTEADFDVKLWADDIHQKAAAILKEEYVKLLNAFITELKEDTATQENIIQVKSLFLKTEGVCPNLDWYASLLEKIANTPENLALIFKIREGLYGPNGKLLRKILEDAAKDPAEKTALLRGMEDQACLKKGGSFFSCRRWELIGEFWYSTSRFQFNSTELKKDLDTLTTNLKIDGSIDRDELTWAAIKLINIIDYKSLDWFHQSFKNMKPEKLNEWLVWIANFLKDSKHEKYTRLLSNLEPELREFGETILEAYTCRSFKDLDQRGLYLLLDKTSLLLMDQEYGAVRYIRDYMNP